MCKQHEFCDIYIPNDKTSLCMSEFSTYMYIFVIESTMFA